MVGDKRDLIIQGKYIYVYQSDWNLHYSIFRLESDIFQRSRKVVYEVVFDESVHSSFRSHFDQARPSRATPPRPATGGEPLQRVEDDVTDASETRR